MDSVVHNIGNIVMRSDIAIKILISLMNGILHSFLFLIIVTLQYYYMDNASHWTKSISYVTTSM